MELSTNPTYASITNARPQKTPLQQLAAEAEIDDQSMHSEGSNDIEGGDRTSIISQTDVWSRQFNAHQRAINRISKFVQSDKMERSVLEMIKKRQEELEKEWTQIHDLFYTLIGQVEEHMVQDYDTAIEVLEEVYFEANSIMSDRITVLEGKIVSDSRSASEVGQDERPIKLIMPVQQHNMQNTWGKFAGKLRSWIGFRDRFKAAIHNNKDISDAYKLSYLLQSLVGPASEALGKSDNYQQAWERLLELYNKPYPIAQEHLRDFYNLPTLQTLATASELERMSNVTHEVIRQLQSLEYPVEHWDFVFVHGLHERLDAKTAREWALSNQSNNPPISEMLKFLDREAAALQHTRNDRKEITVTVNNDAKSVRSSNMSRKDIGKNTGTIAKQFRCEACPEYHKLYECPSFNSLNLNARKELLKRRRICVNCLKKGHDKDNCFDEKRCSYQQCRDDPIHNSLLCPYKMHKSARVNMGQMEPKA